MASVLSKNAKQRVTQIHLLSKLINGKTKKAYERKLLSLIDKHAVEIRDLHQKKDKHFLIETGDLAILCFELLKENRKNLDQVLEVCFDRYDQKLLQLKKEKHE